MESRLDRSEAAERVVAAEPRRRVDGRLVVLLVVVALYSREMLRGSLNPVALRTWTTVFVAIVVQALPFLALGVLVSGAITALVSPTLLGRLLPRSALLAVPGAALAGTALPGCECASVTVWPRTSSWWTRLRILPVGVDAAGVEVQGRGRGIGWWVGQ